MSDKRIEMIHGVISDDNGRQDADSVVLIIINLNIFVEQIKKQ